jgi:hypothetical protein
MPNHRNGVPVPVLAVSVLAKLRPIVDSTIQRLTTKHFVVDPIAGPRYSRITSVVSSSYKRHGHILERALLERLKENPELIVWTEPLFQVSQGADQLIGTLMGDPQSAIGSNINYGAGVRTLQTDIIVYNKASNAIASYEVKRGSGLHDSGKRRSILRDTLCTQILLQSYGKAFDLPVSSARSYVIFYYGMCSINKPFSLTKEELNEHFDFPVTSHVDLVNAYFERRLFALLDEDP